MKSKNLITAVSVTFNIIIIVVIIYFLSSASFSADIENDDRKVEIKYDSINKKNNVTIVEISPEQFKSKMELLSKNKKCVVIFWASWCKYCPSLIKVITKAHQDSKYDFNLLLVSIDKPNFKGKQSLSKKIALLNLRGEQYITSVNHMTNISNSDVIYDYLPEGHNFDQNPGYPHILLVDKGRLVFEDTGYDEIVGLSKYINLLIR